MGHIYEQAIVWADPHSLQPTGGDDFLAKSMLWDDVLPA